MFMELSDDFICESCYLGQVRNRLYTNGFNEEFSDEIVNLTKQKSDSGIMQNEICFNCKEMKSCYPSIFLLGLVAGILEYNLPNNLGEEAERSF